MSDGNTRDQWVTSVLGVDVAAHRTSMRLPEPAGRKKGPAVAKAPAGNGRAKGGGPADARAGGPPADAKPAAPAQVKGRAVLEFEMPFGTMKYFADWDKEIKPLLTEANAKFLEAEDAETSLEDTANEMEHAVEKLGPLDRLADDVRKNTDRTNKLEAGNAQDADVLMEHMTNTLQRIRSDVKAAQTHLQITDDDRTAASKKQHAAHLLKKNEEMQAGLNLFLGLVDEAISLGTSELGDPSKVAVKAAGYITKVFRLGESLAGNPFVEEAQKLQKEAQQIEMANLAARYKLAGEQLQTAKTHLAKEVALFRKASRVFMERWSSAEANFDKASKGKFRFKDLNGAIDLAKRAGSFARDAIEKQYAAERTVKLLKRIPTNKAGPWMAEPREGLTILEEMDTAMNIEPTVKRRDRATKVLNDLSRSYEAVREAMAT